MVKVIIVVCDFSISVVIEVCCLGLVDFLKVFEVGFERNRVGNNGFIFDEFLLIDSLMVFLVNCGFELEVEDMVGVEFVKCFW